MKSKKIVYLFLILFISIICFAGFSYHTDNKVKAEDSIEINSFSDLVSAISNNTNANFVFTNQIIFTDTITISKEKSFKFDLNGYSILSDVSKTLIKNYGNLEIINETEAYSKIDGATASYGAAIYNEGTLIAKSIIFSNCYATDSGAAIHSDCGSIFLFDSIFLNNKLSSNTMSQGGALYLSNSTVQIYNCSFLLNSSGVYGGAIFAVEGDIYICDSSITNNSSENGGAIYTANSNMLIKNTTISNNSATREGGAIFSDQYSGNTLKLDNVEITDNTIKYRDGGGGIYLCSGTLELSNRVIIKDNYYQSQKSNLYFYDPNRVEIDPTGLSQESEIYFGSTFYSSAANSQTRITISKPFQSIDCFMLDNNELTGDLYRSITYDSNDQMVVLDDYKYFKITAGKDNTTVSFKKYKNPTMTFIEYSTNGTSWSTKNMSASDSVWTYTLSKKGDYVYIRADITECDSSNYIQYIGSPDITLSGDIKYLLSRDGLVKDVPNYAFYKMFYSTAGGAVSHAKNLIIDFNSAGLQSFGSMFSGNRYLYDGPSIKINNLTDKSLENMFAYCQNLKCPPEKFEFQNIGSNSLNNIFVGATYVNDNRLYPENYEFYISGANLKHERNVFNYGGLDIQDTVATYDAYYIDNYNYSLTFPTDFEIPDGMTLLGWTKDRGPNQKIITSKTITDSGSNIYYAVFASSISENKYESLTNFLSSLNPELVDKDEITSNFLSNLYYIDTFDELVELETDMEVKLKADNARQSLKDSIKAVADIVEPKRQKFIDFYNNFITDIDKLKTEESIIEYKNNNFTRLQFYAYANIVVNDIYKTELNTTTSYSDEIYILVEGLENDISLLDNIEEIEDIRIYYIGEIILQLYKDDEITTLLDKKANINIVTEEIVALFDSIKDRINACTNTSEIDALVNVINYEIALQEYKDKTIVELNDYVLENMLDDSRYSNAVSTIKDKINLCSNADEVNSQKNAMIYLLDLILFQDTSITVLNEKMLDVLYPSDAFTELKEGLVATITALTTIEETNIVIDYYNEQIKLQNEKDDAIIYLRSLLPLAMYSEELKLIVNNMYDDILLLTSIDDVKAKKDALEFSINLQLLKDRTISYVNSIFTADLREEFAEKYSSVRSVINAQTTEVGINDKKKEYIDFVNLEKYKQATFKEINAIYKDKTDLSKELHSIVDGLEPKVKALTSVEELDNFKEATISSINLQILKDDTIADLNNQFSIYTSSASLKLNNIISSVYERINKGIDSLDIDSIKNQIINEVELQLYKDSKYSTIDDMMNSISTKTQELLDLIQQIKDEIDLKDSKDGVDESFSTINERIKFRRKIDDAKNEILAYTKYQENPSKDFLDLIQTSLNNLEESKDDTILEFSLRDGIININIQLAKDELINFANTATIKSVELEETLNQICLIIDAQREISNIELYKKAGLDEIKLRFEKDIALKIIYDEASSENIRSDETTQTILALLGEINSSLLPSEIDSLVSEALPKIKLLKIQDEAMYELNKILNNKNELSDEMIKLLNVAQIDIYKNTDQAKINEIKENYIDEINLQLEKDNSIKEIKDAYLDIEDISEKLENIISEVILTIQNSAASSDISNNKVVGIEKIELQLSKDNSLIEIESETPADIPNKLRKQLNNYLDKIVNAETKDDVLDNKQKAIDSINYYITTGNTLEWYFYIIFGFGGLVVIYLFMFPFRKRLPRKLRKLWFVK